MKINKQQNRTIMKFLTVIIAFIVATTMAQSEEGGPQPDADAGVSFKMTKYYLF